MKKFTFVAAMAIAAASIVASCGNSTSSKPNLKNDVDTLSYAMGMAQTQGLKQYLAQMEIDTTYMDAFIKGLNEGANAGDDKKKAAYYMGIQIGQQISNRMVKGINHELFGEDSTKTISLKNFMAGFIQGVKGKKGLMTVEQAGQVAQMKMMAIKAKNMEEQYGPLKKKGEEWMAANAKKAGVKKLGKGVQYEVIKEGSGAIPKTNQSVKINYELKTIDGKVIETTFGKQPAMMPVNGVIPGFTEALTHMTVGSKWVVYIPYSAGYGAQKTGPIEPFSNLIFTIELLEVNPAPQAPRE